MWEKIKENGFNIASIAVVGANLFLFSLMALQGIVQVWEPTKLVLGVEIGLSTLLLVWGIERLVRDL